MVRTALFQGVNTGSIPVGVTNSNLSACYSGDMRKVLKAEFFDNVYLQQNAFDDVDAATSAERQRFSATLRFGQ